MMWLQPYFSPSYWRRAFVAGKATKSIFAAFGAVWLFVEIASFFSQDAAGKIKSNWLVFTILCILWALWDNRPVHHVFYRLKGRDVLIEIRVGDIFGLSGSMVVPTNRTFDTMISDDLISPMSIQGAFTGKYYNNVAHLDHDIDCLLEGIPYEEEESEKIGKKRLYPVGTCIKLSTKDRISYWVAIAKLNNHGRAQGAVEDVRVSLPVLWEYVSDKGDYGTILVPIIGSGYSRLAQSREEIIREILQSFVAACSSRKPCEKLVIVIATKDYYDHEMNLEELGDYLLHICKYTDFRDSTVLAHGSRIS